MRVFVDADTQRIITGPGIPMDVQFLNFKRATYASLEVQFCRAGQIVELPLDATGIFEVKPPGKYDFDPVTGAMSWIKTGAGITSLYTFVFTFVTVPLDALFFVDANVDNDVAILKLMGEIQWVTGGVQHKTQTIDINLANDVIREGDLLPTMPPVVYGVFIPSITGLTGGTPSDLDALPTVGIITGTIIEVLVEVTGVLTWLTYRLDPGPATEAPPAEVEPLDYNATTNDRHWRGAAGPSGPAGVNAGHHYLWNTSTATADPGAGKAAVNNAAVASATELYISGEDGNGTDISGLLATWDDSTSTIRGRVMFQDPETPENFAVFDIIGEMTANSGWNTFEITPVASGGTITNNRPVQVFFFSNGDKGDQGDPGSDGGLKFQFNEAITGDPGPGKFLFDDVAFMSATEFSISKTDLDTNDVGTLLAALDDGTSDNKCLVIAQKGGGIGLFSFYITGAAVDNSTYFTFPITPVLTSGAIADEDNLFLHAALVGDQGSTGATGAGGLAGLKYTFFDNVSSGNPGNGYLKWNHASPASATLLYISDLEGNYNNIEPLLSTWDDSTNSIKGKLFIQKADNPGIFAVFNITGNQNDFSGYKSFPITFVSGAGTFTAEDLVVGLFIPYGNAGAAGAAGGTTYDAPVAIAAGATPSIDLSAVAMSTLRLLAANTTVSFTSPVAGKVTILHFKQAASGTAWTVTFSGTIIWVGTGGVAPTMSPGFNVVDAFTFWYDGTNLYGSWAPGA